MSTKPEPVLRWIATEVDAGREISPARTAAAWEVSLSFAIGCHGMNWERYRVPERTPVQAAPAERSRCPRCGRVGYLEADEYRVMTLACFNCGPQYGRRAPTAEEMTAGRPNNRQRHRPPSHAGRKL